MATTTEPVLVLFDIDGTLLAPNGCGRAAFTLTLGELVGRHNSWHNISFAGKTDRQILQDCLLPHGYSKGQILELIPPFMQLMQKHMAAIISDYDVRPLPGALALVDGLSRDPRARLGLVTGNVEPTVAIKLRAAGFDPDLFPVGAFGNESASRSDLPPIAVRRAEALWKTEFVSPRIVIVGDTPNDMICARSVNGRAIGVLTGPVGIEAIAAEAPYAILDDLSDTQHVKTVIFGEP